MIAVSHGKPKIIFRPASNDMAQFFPSRFIVMANNWGWMELNDYMAKKEFQEFDMEFKPDPTPEQVEEVLNYVQSGKEIEFYETFFNPALKHVYLMKQQIKKSGGHLTWQYNLVNQNLDGWIRQVVSLGHNSEYSLRPISLFDRKVKLPILNIICNQLNKLLYFKRKKEIANWNEVLKKAPK